MINISKSSRRTFLKTMGLGAMTLATSGGLAFSKAAEEKPPKKRPNILLAISDDQSWPHAGAYGAKFVKTPAFDRVAREGILFSHAYCPAPQCSPCRASLLTGRNIWQNEEAGTHASLFPKHLEVYPELLEKAGYFVGTTGKAWGPGNWKGGGRDRNPAGPGFNKRTAATPAKGIAKNDYAANFQDFLDEKPKDQPFCFWYGAYEPHRSYEKGSGLKAGKKLEDVEVPAFLPDTEEIREDILDYAFEIEWFDTHLGRIIAALEKAGDLDNTLIVVTSDNGMPFPRAKANLYELGTHAPMAMRWGDRMPKGRKVDDFVSFIDLAPTFLEAAGLTPPAEMTGGSLLSVLTSEKSGRVDPKRDRVFTGRERHTHARPENLGYPARAIRTYEFLYIHNIKPDLWPAGDPDGSKGGYYDIDSAPSKSILLNNRETAPINEFFDLATAKRPEEELYAVEKDRACLKNLAADPEYAAVKKQLRDELDRVLKEQKDPRALGNGDIFDSYPRFSPMRKQFEGFSEQGKYNPKYIQTGQKVPVEFLPEK